MSDNDKPTLHTPVLLSQVVRYLQPASGETYLDLTAGYGGHTSVIAAKIGQGKLVLVDRDLTAVHYLGKKFKAAQVIHKDYLSAANELCRQGFKADMVLMDLGVSSVQFDTTERGFSFRKEAPLDMRMDQSQQLSAYDIVNNASEAELADILWQFGQERKSRQIAAAIVQARPITTTTQLAKIIARAFPYYQRIHPATRSFQALRIATNNELGQLEATLPLLPQLLNRGGRIVFISFHSLEDSLIKHFLKSHPQEFAILTKKVVKGSIEDATNPRARSAKLRAAVKK